VLLTLTAATATAQQFRVTGATLKADDRRPTGQCRVTVVFRGSITANGPGRVTYTFRRSDGTISPVYEAEFKKAGVLPVETAWTLGDAQLLPRYEGWEAVKVLSPNALESNHATGRFTLACAASPAGGRIVFTSERDGNYEIYSMNADGSGLTRLTNSSVFEDTPSWSPDGTKIAFASVTPGGSHIYLLDLSTGATTQLTNDSARDNEPDWSPDGAFARRRGRQVKAALGGV
jgi:WD40 repeat protein